MNISFKIFYFSFLCKCVDYFFEWSRVRFVLVVIVGVEGVCIIIGFCGVVELRDGIGYDGINKGGSGVGSFSELGVLVMNVL